MTSRTSKGWSPSTIDLAREHHLLQLAPPDGVDGACHDRLPLGAGADGVDGEAGRARVGAARLGVGGADLGDPRASVRLPEHARRDHQLAVDRRDRRAARPPRSPRCREVPSGSSTSMAASASATSAGATRAATPVATRRMSWCSHANPCGVQESMSASSRSASVWPSGHTSRVTARSFAGARHGGHARVPVSSSTEPPVKVRNSTSVKPARRSRSISSGSAGR